MKRARKPSAQMVAVLFALAESGAQRSHGYDLCRELGLKAGTVYPILRRLDERGLVETQWEQDPPPGRPARHLYRLSGAGAELVVRLVSESSTTHRVAASSPRAAFGSTG